MQSLERTYLLVERSSKDSTYIEGPSYSRNDKEDEEFSLILEQRRGGEPSTSGRNMKESFSNEEDEILLKASYEGDIILSIKPSYVKLFRMCHQLVKENSKLRKRTIGLKESLRYLKEIKIYFKIEITKLRNSK